MALSFSPVRALRSDIDSNLRCNCSREFTLQTEDVLQVVFVALAPQWTLFPCLDESRGYAHSVSDVKHRTFHDPIDIQFLRNLPQGLSRIVRRIDF